MNSRVPFLFAACLLFFNPRSWSAEPHASRDSAPWTSPSTSEVDSVYLKNEALYLDLHRNPELSLHEQNTAAKLAERMKDLGYQTASGVGGTGVVAVLRNGPGRVVLLRTDMDALPVEELTGLPYASKVTAKNDAGETVHVAHACGHDLHMAAWCGTAELMARNKSRWHGTLILIAQPAEEILKGARAMLGDGLFKKFPKPDFALAVHDAAHLPSGQVGYIPGYGQASSDSVNITVYGRGGHGAEPQNTVDPIVIASRIVVALQTIVSREMDPRDPAVITVGSFHGGTKNNIIPDEVQLKLTVREYREDIRKKLLAAIKRVVKGEALAGGAPREPLVTQVAGANAAFNDPVLTNRVADALRKSLGAKNVVLIRPSMTSEDFSEFALAGVPSAMFYIGAVEPGKFKAAKASGKQLPGLHSSLWAPDFKPALKTAVKVETAALLEVLEN